MGLFSNKSYYKPGKGVEKDAPQKNAFFHFFELYGRKFWRFIEVNFIYLLVLLPILLAVIYRGLRHHVYHVPAPGLYRHLRVLYE